MEKLFFPFLAGPTVADNAFIHRARRRLVLPQLGRLVDTLLSRGEGLDARGDPFGPPLSDDETARLLDVVRHARFDERAPPFTSPIPMVDTWPRVPVVLRPPRRGATWAILAHPYGGFAAAGKLGLYEVHARLLDLAGIGIAAPEAPYHGARAQPERPSGWGFVRADLAHTTRAILASAAEVMALARHLREVRGARRVVGLGISLGGEAVGLAAALGAPFDRLAFLAAVDNPASFYATGENREARRRTLAANGFGMTEVARAYEAVAPSTYPAPSAPGVWAIPEHDLVVPAATQRAWRDAWRGERMDLVFEGHGLALSSPLVAWRLARWLAKDPKTADSAPETAEKAARS